MAIIGPLVGRQDLIGETYDCAIGFADSNNGGNTLMYGYVLAPGSNFEESTNLQDEQHLVQVASPLSTDRFGRYPKVSQGDWSGGERQEIFVTPTQYYTSSQMDTSKPGHLRALAKYTTATVTKGIGFGQGRVLMSDSARVIGIGSNGGHSWLSQYNIGNATVQQQDLGATAVAQDLIRGGIGIFFYLTATLGGVGLGVYQGQLNSFQGVSLDTYPASTVQTGIMAQFDGVLYYATGTNASTLASASTLSGTPTAGTVLYTVPVYEQGILCLCDGTSGVVFITGDGIEERNFVYVWDGTNANFIAALPGIVQDMVLANGVVYILVDAPSFTAAAPQPVIYALSGSTISLFDDYRTLDPAFQTVATAPGGNLDTDGQYLYLFHPGLSTKRYRLSSGAVYDAGTPGIAGINANHQGCALLQGGLAEVGTPGTHLFIVQPEIQSNASGVIVTSFYDWDTPTVDKSFKSIEFSLNTAITPSGVSVAFKLDNLSNAFTNMTVQISPSGNSLIAYFPARTIGHRIQFQITLGSGANAPDVAAIAILATLARQWTFTVACRRDQRSRNPSDQVDVQDATTQQLIANIMNAYMIAGGNITLWIPDPTIAPIVGGASGMIQVNAQIQDYKRDSTAGAGAGWRRGVEGVPDFDADIQLVISEVL